MIVAIVIVADAYTLYDSINFGLFRATLTVIGGCLIVVVMTWRILTERSRINAGPKGKIVIKTIMVLFAAFVIYALLPSYVRDMMNLDVKETRGRVTDVDIYPPPIYFLSQNFNFDGEGNPSNYHVGVSTFYVVKGKSYAIKYLPHSRLVLTIKEISAH